MRIVAGDLPSLHSAEIEEILHNIYAGTEARHVGKNYDRRTNQ